MDLALMQDVDIFVKTDAGRDEIKSRARGLSMPVRAILLMVDGQRTVAALRAVIGGSKAPDDTLDTLLAEGLIEARDVAAGPGASMAEPAPAAAPPAASGPVPAPSVTTKNPHAPPVATDVLDLALPTIYEEAPAPSTDVATAAAATPNRYERLYTMMNEVVRDFLPAHRRYFLQLKIERAGTAEELLELLHDLRTSLAKSRGDAFANDVVARLRSAAV